MLIKPREIHIEAHSERDNSMSTHSQGCNSSVMGWVCQLPTNFSLYFRQYRFFRTAVLFSILLFYCEFIHYYVILIQCTWPTLQAKEVFDTPLPVEQQPLRVMILGDTHLLGSHGHWFDRIRREWQMERVFQASMFIHSPDVIFVLGDLLDEGKWCSDSEFERTVKRFKKIFYTPKNKDMYIVVGNHDIGFHYVMTHHKEHRFDRAFDAPSVRMLRIRDNIFVLVNSMTLEGDGCSLCWESVRKLEQISKQLNCAQDPNTYTGDSPSCSKEEQFTYTKPILLQHFPMYRRDDSKCDTPDAAPPEEKTVPFKPKWDCLSQDATKQMFDLINPRLVISAHTHHGCHRIHANDVPEWTIPSFNWRNKNNPSFLLASISNDSYLVKRCMMPVETTVISVYVVGAVFILISLIFPRRVVKFNTEKAH